MPRSSIPALCILLLLAPLPCVAATHIWTGASSDQFSDPGNWTGGSPAGGTVQAGSYATIIIPILNDGVQEGTESFVVTLTGVTGGQLLRTEAVITILDDDVQGINAPAAVVATAGGSTQATISWLPVQRATRYEVFRSLMNAAPVLVGSTATTSFGDGSLTPNRTHVYTVRAIGATGVSAFSAPDIATTIVFTDDPIVPRQTIIQVQHMIELRAAVQAVRESAGLQQNGSLEPITRGLPVRLAHIETLRAALNEARAALGLPPISFSDPALTTSTQIRAAHLQEIRKGVR